MSKSNNQEFLIKLKTEAKLISSLEKEKFIPDQLSAVADFVATHAWQILLLLALMTSFFWELLIYQANNG
jgi:hypothetical protein